PAMPEDIYFRYNFRNPPFSFETFIFQIEITKKHYETIYFISKKEIERLRRKYVYHLKQNNAEEGAARRLCRTSI
ncbi:hypothetical protein, partial [Citrobacter sp. wls615]|uniref:hypothetical protein n=1 Tax=Citrobacter sp. wls615 TaxID=2576435 RepID=UPI001BAEFFB0